MIKLPLPRIEEKEMREMFEIVQDREQLERWRIRFLKENKAMHSCIFSDDNEEQQLDQDSIDINLAVYAGISLVFERSGMVTKSTSVKSYPARDYG